MRKMKLIFIGLIAFSFLLTSCTGSKTNKAQKNVNFLKAKKDTTWLYDGELFKSKKSIEVKIMEANKKTMMDNKNQMYTKDEKGYKNQYYYWIQYPIKKGTSWVNHSKNMTDIATIEDVHASFKFGEDEIKHCIKVSYVRGLNNGGRNITVRTFCPELWLVQMETYYETSEGIATKQSSFHLKSFVY